MCQRRTGMGFNCLEVGSWVSCRYAIGLFDSRTLLFLILIPIIIYHRQATPPLTRMTSARGSYPTAGS